MAVEITLIIPTEYVNRVLSAANGLANKNIRLTVKDNINGHWMYNYLPKNGEETNKEFAERVIKETVRALVRLYDYAEDIVRYDSEVAAIDPPEQDVPDEIIE